MATVQEKADMAGMLYRQYLSGVNLGRLLIFH